MILVNTPYSSPTIFIFNNCSENNGGGTRVVEKKAFHLVTMVLVLELFCGTKSFGKVCEKRGWSVVSLDIDAKSQPTIVADILDWDYENSGLQPDVIWCSPPCESFSFLGNGNGHNPRKRAFDGSPLTEAARKGEQILQRTCEIIQFFQPKVYVIENPLGYMKKRLPLYLEGYNTSMAAYCMYDMPYRKRTNLFSNIDLKFPKCTHRKHTANVAFLPRNVTYVIPEKLCETIAQKVEEHLLLSSAFSGTRPSDSHLFESS